MATKPLGKIGRSALWFLPIAIVVGGYISSLPWLKQQSNALVLVVGAVAAIFVMGYSQFIAYRLNRGMDEVQIASQGFASSRGWVWGAMATVLLLMLPPVTNWLIDLANVLSAGSPDKTDRGAMHIAIFLGFMLVVVTQCVCVFVAAIVWWRRMGTSA